MTSGDRSGPAVSGDALRVRDLFCLYPLPGGGTVAALRGLAITLAIGERLIVHGPNGSGKTTLLRVLTGELQPSAGSVLVAGAELTGASRSVLTELRSRTIGRVDQHAGRTLRPELDVLDNVALQLRVAGVAARAARAAARDTLESLGVGALARRTIATLSAGEAQRVAVCAAVAHGPSLVLADEPTGELDSTAADAVYDLLSAATSQAGASLLLVTHDVRAARIADRLVRIRDGRLSEQWHPSSAGEEELVVDDRGWVRLPEPVRTRVGIHGRARIRERDGGIVLDDPAPSPAVTESTAPALPGPLFALDGPAAELSAVDVSYGDRAVLSNFSAVVEAGCLTVVRGRSGSGKSTVLALMLGLTDPDRGIVRLAGHDLAGHVVGGSNRHARSALRRRLTGVAVTGGALAEPLDVRDNLALARSARGLAAPDDVVESVLEALDLAAVSRRAVRNLSGGERQRSAIARAVVVQRPIVVLDEPTSQQDEAHAERVAAALVALAAAGAAVVCATHDPVLVAVAGAVIELL